jgi:hypothetical protein
VRDIELGPAQATELGIGLLAPAMMEEARQQLGPDLQVMITVTAAILAGGHQWSIAPNPAARTAEEAFSLPPAEIPRSMVNIAGSHPDGMCHDDRDQPFSEGAVVAVRDEPGRFVRCSDAVWKDYVLPGVGEGAASPPPDGWALDLALTQPDAPVLLRGYTANAGTFLYEAVKVQNASDMVVTAISFGVIVADSAEPQEGWSMVRTWPLPVALPARATRQLQANLLPPSQLTKIVRTFTGSPKITLGILDVQWEDGSKWQFDVPSGSLDFSAGHGSLLTVASVPDTGPRAAASGRAGR